MTKGNTKNWYKHIPKKLKKKEPHNPNYMQEHVFKHPFRCLIVGKTGSGKTLSLIDMVTKLGSMFSNIVVCLKVRDEPLYDMLDEMTGKQVDFYEGTTFAYGPTGRKRRVPHIPAIDKVNQKDSDGNWEQTLVVFDDLQNEKNQEGILEYLIRGRKKNISCVYIAQNYYQCPKIIRDNVSYIMMKRGITDKDLRRLLKEQPLDCNLDELRKTFYTITKQDVSSFMLIDLNQSNIHDGFSVEPEEVTRLGNTEDIEEDMDYREPNPLPKRRSDQLELKRQRASKKGTESKRELGRISVNEFIEHLIRNEVHGSFDVKTLYEAYTEFCDTNDIYTAPKRTFGSLMTDFYPKSKVNNVVYYQI